MKVEIFIPYTCKWMSWRDDGPVRMRISHDNQEGDTSLNQNSFTNIPKVVIFADRLLVND